MIAICEIQGDNLYSPLAGQTVQTEGVVTAIARRGFFLQTPNVEHDGSRSDAIFVYSPDWQPAINSHMEITGEVVDYAKGDNGKPYTQIKFDQAKPLSLDEDDIPPVWLTAENLPTEAAACAKFLNSLEGMMVGIKQGARFIGPSNLYGDYVLDVTGLSAQHPAGGALLEASNPLRWYPGFRITNYSIAPSVNVGAELTSDVVGPLHYRVEAYQMAVSSDFEFTQRQHTHTQSKLKAEPGYVTIMTLNCFNLDTQIESPDKVMNPLQDVDDDWGEGRFHALANAIVEQANCPDIIALQEIQDNDGAELSDVVAANKTYQVLTGLINKITKQHYQWVDVAPVLNEDGGQPGGNIRNGFLYNADRFELLPDTVAVFGQDEACFVDSRKPLVTHFRDKDSSHEIACINLHLASKRHQNSIFAPEAPGIDGKLDIRVQQAVVVKETMDALSNAGIDYYVTGDFNDTEESQTLLTMCGEQNKNLVLTMPAEQRYDYNHRGKLQVLMHGIVHQDMLLRGAEYEVLHGNELLGIKPGGDQARASDHAYVMAKLKLNK